jgi:PBP1b-binding outer membrane lipoprotein LpoB
MKRIILVAIFLAGCAAPPPKYTPVPEVLVPDKPVVPTISEKELAPLSDDTVDKLVDRDTKCWNYARELRALLGR